MTDTLGAGILGAGIRGIREWRLREGRLQKGWGRRPRWGRAGLSAAALTLLLTACGESRIVVRDGEGTRLQPQAGATRTATTQAAPSGAGTGRYKVGKAYQINGKWYHPKVDYTYDETGIASWYGPKFHGRKTANGETFDQWQLTAAHKTLPLPSMIRVTNLDNGRQIKLRVNDRGPFSRGRILDVSTRAAELLKFKQQGTAKVRVQIIESESRRLAALTQGEAPPASDVPKAAPSVGVVTASADVGASTAGATQKVSGQNSSGQNGTARNGAGAPGSRARVRDVPPPDGKVTVVPVANNDIFIQAGAFLRYDNARRLRGRLANVAPTRIQEVTVRDRRFFRVRLGPVETVAEADRLLERLLGQGHREAQLVID